MIPPAWKRPLALWLAAFLSTGLLLFFYAGVPLLPIMASGLLALVVTLLRLRQR